MTEIVPLFPEEKKESVLGVSQNQVFFGARVDYNLRNISSSGYSYIAELLDNLFKTLIHTPEKNTDAGFYMRVEREIQKCGLFEIKKIIELIDAYLPRPHMQQSREADTKYSVYTHTKRALPTKIPIKKSRNSGF